MTSKAAAATQEEVARAERQGHAEFVHKGKATRWWLRPAEHGGGMACSLCHPDPRTLTQEDQ